MYLLHKIHGHSHLNLDPEDVFYGHIQEGAAVAVAVDLMQNIRTRGQKFLHLTKNEILMPRHAL